MCKIVLWARYDLPLKLILHQHAVIYLNLEIIEMLVKQSTSRLGCAAPANNEVGLRVEIQNVL
jgi:hypothetical protein